VRSTVLLVMAILFAGGLSFAWEIRSPFAEECCVCRVDVALGWVVADLLCPDESVGTAKAGSQSDGHTDPDIALCQMRWLHAVDHGVRAALGALLGILAWCVATRILSRPKDGPTRCGNCGHILTCCPGLRCPECGSTA
jgi:hypothetical protein